MLSLLSLALDWVQDHPLFESHSFENNDSVILEETKETKEKKGSREGGGGGASFVASTFVHVMM